MKLEKFLDRISKKQRNIKVHNNLSKDSRLYGRTDRTKLIVAFRNFANVPKRVCNWLENEQFRRKQAPVIRIS